MGRPVTVARYKAVSAETVNGCLQHPNAGRNKHGECMRCRHDTAAKRRQKIALEAKAPASVKPPNEQPPRHHDIPEHHLEARLSRIPDPFAGGAFADSNREVARKGVRGGWGAAGLMGWK